MPGKNSNMRPSKVNSKTISPSIHIDGTLVQLANLGSDSPSNPEWDHPPPPPPVPPGYKQIINLYMHNLTSICTCYGATMQDYFFMQDYYYNSTCSSTGSK